MSLSPKQVCCPSRHPQLPAGQHIIPSPSTPRPSTIALTPTLPLPPTHNPLFSFPSLPSFPSSVEIMMTMATAAAHGDERTRTAPCVVWRLLYWTVHFAGPNKTDDAPHKATSQTQREEEFSVYPCVSFYKLS